MAVSNIHSARSHEVGRREGGDSERHQREEWTGEWIWSKYISHICEILKELIKYILLTAILYRSSQKTIQT